MSQRQADRPARRPPNALAMAVAAVAVPLRRRCWQWGATAEEAFLPLPGDALLPAADVTATRAITIRAPAARVWPWIAQLGQGRAGFYSYEFLENLIGCQIRNADEVVPAWQSVGVGDAFHLHPRVALTVAEVEPGRALVVRGGVPMGSKPAPYDFTWAFVLRDGPGGTTRLLVRERYAASRGRVALLVEPVGMISFVMSRRMLRGIKARAER